MRRIVLAVTTVLVVAAGPISFAAQSATGNTHRETPHVSKIDNPSNSALADPAARSVM